MYKIYRIYSKAYYIGTALISAESEKEANEFLENFKKQDKDNFRDSWGYRYAQEENIVAHLFSDIKGIIDYGIEYRG